MSVCIKVGDFHGQIGRIDYVHLGTEDHGMFTVELGFDFGETHQGTGHLILGAPSRDEWLSTKFLHELSKAVGPLTSCKGNEVVVLRQGDRWHEPIRGVMPLIGGEPFIFAEALDDAKR